jgi:hypothetical protein
MVTGRKVEWLSIEDYLAGEQFVEVRHEYVQGAVYAIVGSTARHDLIAVPMLIRLRAHLKLSMPRLFVGHEGAGRRCILLSRCRGELSAI